MSQYNLRIVYKPGATNQANALSRCPDYAINASIDDPIIALPSNLFVPPETLTQVPVVEVSRPHHLRVTDISDHILETDLETSITSAQYEEPQLL